MARLRKAALSKLTPTSSPVIVDDNDGIENSLPNSIDDGTAKNGTERAAVAETKMERMARLQSAMSKLTPTNSFDEGDDVAGDDAASMGGEAIPGSASWLRFASDDGSEYYYNVETAESTWEVPVELADLLAVAPDTANTADTPATGGSAGTGRHTPADAAVATTSAVTTFAPSTTAVEEEAAPTPAMQDRIGGWQRDVQPPDADVAESAAASFRQMRLDLAAEESSALENPTVSAGSCFSALVVTPD